MKQHLREPKVFEFSIFKVPVLLWGLFVPDSFWHDDLFAHFSIYIKNQRKVWLKTTNSEEAIHKGSHEALKEIKYVRDKSLSSQKKILDFAAIKRIFTQRYSAATERWCWVTVQIKAAKNSVLYSSQQKRCKPDQNRCQYVHHRWPGTTVFVWRPMELC